jgi:hypothetical protein
LQANGNPVIRTRAGIVWRLVVHIGKPLPGDREFIGGEVPAPFGSQDDRFDSQVESFLFPKGCEPFGDG